MKRTFLAIDLPSEIKDKLTALQEELGYLSDIKWVKPENFHLTLVFLGWISQSEQKKVCQIAKEGVEEIEPFSLHLKGCGVFPEIRRPKILWIGVDGGLKLKLLNCTLFRKIGEAGFKLDEREFTPHITIGRAKGRLDKENVIYTLNKYKDRDFGSFVVDCIEIMESELKRTGPVYKVIESVQFQERGKDDVL